MDVSNDARKSTYTAMGHEGEPGFCLISKAGLLPARTVWRGLQPYRPLPNGGEGGS